MGAQEERGKNELGRVLMVWEVELTGRGIIRCEWAALPDEKATVAQGCL